MKRISMDFLLMYILRCMSCLSLLALCTVHVGTNGFWRVSLVARIRDGGD